MSLPIASTSGNSQSFIDALFVATSAISTTGLTVVDLGSFYSLFGQIVILVLVQIGGLGYMIFIVMIVLQLGVKLSLGGKLVLEESMSSPPYEEVSRFSRAIIFITLIFEFLGAVVLSLYWMREFPVKHAIYLGIFHSVSAFCTAGFSLFPDNLSAYRDNIVINVIIDILCIVGSVGFFVIYDVYNMVSRKKREDETPKKLLVHTKLVLIMLPILIITGALLIYLSEWNTPLPSFKDRILTSTFQAIAASTTTGFNTLDTGMVKTLGLATMVILMYIGASPGGTGGGVKTTTFGVLISSTISVISMKEELILFNRRISARTKDKAFAICTIALLLIALDVLILSVTENASFMEIVFETVSAFGTVGLSTGITPTLSFTGKIVLVVTMLIGRVGPLAIGFSIRGKCKVVPIKYPEGGILVG
ncbi:MAG: TrkH family potassium uptake protein [Candidatus Brocadiaceae bacterium]|uniref:TrkH family potassium uptake protein n=1 Tax=Candidatus Wunengus sp. YC61 TaxID=3367698 RepID=UPI00271B657A|nr:TrkH family potassium uptake protein [Candidatus Brocadiaceae bacterium]